VKGYKRQEKSDDRLVYKQIDHQLTTADYEKEIKNNTLIILPGCGAIIYASTTTSAS
jgi:hypothetical protein